MGIEVDSFGSIYVADLGNHRIQRFIPVRQTLVGEAISAMFGFYDRTYYVARSAPGEKPGEFKPRGHHCVAEQRRR